MAEVLITSFFTRGGLPAINIEAVTAGFPVVRIWEVFNGTTSGDTFVGEFGMTPVEEGSNDDGFYKYEFDTGDGYDPLKTYIFRSDGGASLPGGERYQVARLDPSENIEAIADAVWDEPRADHLQVGSTGEALSQIKADTTDLIDKLYLDADSVLEVVQLLLKLEAGRTRINPANQTLTIYDENCSTPLRVFQLLDSSGTPSVTEVCERKPITKGIGDGTSITDVCP